jgi:HlyD family secretion protein
LLLLALIAWGLWPKPIVIETGVAARSPLTVRVSEEGKTRVRNRYVIAAPVAGKMRRLPLKPGDAVVAGKTLLTTIEPVAAPLLDPRARMQAEAVVSLNEASRNRALESLEAARTALKLAEADRDRMRSVKQDGTISESDRDRMEAEASIKAAEVRAAEFSLQVIDYELARARAVLERPDASTAGNLVEVKSPVSGKVLNVMRESETVISPGMAILEIGDPADIEIEAEILSRDAVAIQPGDSAEIEQWGGDNPLQGRVRRVEPAAFTKISALGVEEQRVIVLCDLINPPDAARALGDRYRVEVRVAVWHADDVLVAPSGALFRQGNAWKTFIHRNGRAELAAIEAGRSDGRLTEILSGLKPGDKVLLHPPDTVRDGSPVRERDQTSK